MNSMINCYFDEFIDEGSLDESLDIEYYLGKGRALLASGAAHQGSLEPFLIYEKAISLDERNFEAYLGLFVSWYLYSLSTKPTEWDSFLDELFYNLLAHTPNEYHEEVKSFYRRSKVNYLAKVRKNGEQ